VGDIHNIYMIYLFEYLLQFINIHYFILRY
jgi:hypothetical protein